MGGRASPLPHRSRADQGTGFAWLPTNNLEVALIDANDDIHLVVPMEEAFDACIDWVRGE